MPIRPENRARYPRDWPRISLYVRKVRAGDRCECIGICGHDHGGRGARCPERNGRPHSVTGSIVVLTVAHLDDTPENNDPENLLAACQRCHLSYDRHIHAAEFRMTYSRRRLAAAANRELFEGADLGGAARLADLRRRPKPIRIRYAEALSAARGHARHGRRSAGA